MSFGFRGKARDSSMCPCLLGRFWWSDVENALQNRRNITLAEQAKWALFLKSFFEISEAIPLAQGSYSIYVPFANDTGDAGQIHKRRSTLENPANPWLKVHVLASMYKLWHIFPGKGSKGKKATKLGSFWLKSGLSVSGSNAKLMSALMARTRVASLLLPQRLRWCSYCLKKSGLIQTLTPDCEDHTLVKVVFVI